MKGAGHLRGHCISSRAAINRVAEALKRLADPVRFQKRYGADEGHGVLLYPVGDGNHSLATAKRCWENLKRQGASMLHPARFALVELMNIHDPGLEFEPIHRLVFNVDAEDLLADARVFFTSNGFEVRESDGQPAKDLPDSAHTWMFTHQKTGSAPRDIHFSVLNPKFVLAAATFTEWFEPYMEKRTQAEVDYVHGNDVVCQECKKSERTVGVFMPSMPKRDLCQTVVQEGVLPKKTFSMGESDEKRFYFEARRILPETVFYRGDFFRRGHVNKPLRSRAASSSII
jgi:hypothetical protein